MHVRHNVRARIAAFAAILPATLLGSPAPARAQGTPALDSLVSIARAGNPGILAAQARARAAEARVAAAGARPDPMLMVGIQNFPIAEPGFSDFMTMKMLGVSQTIPRRGKLAARTRVAEYEADAARLEAEAAALDVVRDVRSVYYEIAYLDQALDIVERTRDVLVSLAGATQARYEVGTTGQQDVIRARLEATRLGDDASALQEQRRAAVAQLNALLDRPPGVAVDRAAIPLRIARAGVANPPDRIEFVSAALGSRAAGSVLPSLDSLEELAARENPEIRAYQAMVAAQSARASLARLGRRPDFDVSLQYGQRNGFTDMLTATVSVVLPIQRERKQDPLLAAERAELQAREAELRDRQAQLRADVADLHSQLERARTQLALTAKALLPQSRAALESAVASYQAGRSEFVTVLDAQAALFNIETSYVRALSDFAAVLAELERLVGGEVLP